MILKKIRVYIGLVSRLYPLLLIFYFFYLVVIDFSYAHADLIVIKIDHPITNEDCIRDRVDYRLTQILMYFVVGATLLILSKLPNKFVNAIFFTNSLTSAGITFKEVLKFYSSFYIIFGFALLLLLAFIYGSVYAKFVIPFHYAMLALLPIYIIFRAPKNANYQPK